MNYNLLLFLLPIDHRFKSNGPNVLPAAASSSPLKYKLPQLSRTRPYAAIFPKVLCLKMNFHCLVIAVSSAISLRTKTSKEVFSVQFIENEIIFFVAQDS